MTMEDGDLGAALERAERALGRIEQALANRPPAGRDDALRERVREAVAELDQMIRSAGA
jgi:hypothetical protein